MSNVPTGTLAFSMRVMIFPRRSAMGTPRRRIPTNPKPSTPPFFSTISYAKRTSVRSISDADISCAFWRRPVLREGFFAFIVECASQISIPYWVQPLTWAEHGHRRGGFPLYSTQRQRSSYRVRVFGEKSDVPLFGGQDVLGNGAGTTGHSRILHANGARQNAPVILQSLQRDGMGACDRAINRQNSYTLISSPGLCPVQRSVGKFNRL